MALLRHAGGLRECLLIGVDRKSSAHSQNGAFDPEQTSDIRSHFSGSKGSWCSHIAARPFRLPMLQFEGMRTVPFATDGDVTRWNRSSPAAALKPLVARVLPTA